MTFLGMKNRLTKRGWEVIDRYLLDKCGLQPGLQFCSSNAGNIRSNTMCTRNGMTFEAFVALLFGGQHLRSSSAKEPHGKEAVDGNITWLQKLLLLLLRHSILTSSESICLPDESEFIHEEQDQAQHESLATAGTLVSEEWYSKIIPSDITNIKKEVIEEPFDPPDEYKFGSAISLETQSTNQTNTQSRDTINKQFLKSINKGYRCRYCRKQFQRSRAGFRLFQKHQKSHEKRYFRFRYRITLKQSCGTPRKIKTEDVEGEDALLFRLLQKRDDQSISSENDSSTLSDLTSKISSDVHRDSYLLSNDTQSSNTMAANPHNLGLCAQSTFVCYICNKQLPDNNSWRKHMLSHGRPRLDRCKVLRPRSSKTHVSLRHVKKRRVEKKQIQKRATMQYVEKEQVEKSVSIIHVYNEWKEQVEKPIILKHEEKEQTEKLINIQDIEKEQDEESVEKPQVENPANKQHKDKELVEKRVDEQQIKKQLKKEEYEKQYQCKVCSSAHSTRESLRQHEKDQHTPQKTVCKFCGISLRKGTNMERHIDCFHAEKSCPRCPEKIMGNKNLKKHLKIHERECSFCKKLLCNKKSRIAHEVRAHKEKAHYKCNICGKVFSILSYYRQHQTTVCVTAAKECSLCGKRYLTEKHYQDHLKYYHEKLPKPFQCTTCGKTFPNNSALVSHMRTHLLDEEKRKDCKFCGKSFLSKSGLIRHERIHTGEAKSFCCEFCGKLFRDKEPLEWHHRTHTGEKPYKCDYCGRRFATVGNMRQHTYTHTGEKRYQCDTCLKNFRSGKSLKAHKEAEHGSEENTLKDEETANK